MRKNIWFPLILVIVLWLVGIGGAYAVIVHSESSKSSVIVLEPNFLFYSDMAGTHSIDKIRLPELTPGSISNFTFYVKNTSSVSQNISAGNILVSTSIGKLIMTFDGQAQKTLAANAIARVDGVLTVSDYATVSPTDFTVSINAFPVTTTAIILPITTTTTTLATGTTLPTIATTTLPPRSTTPPVILDGQVIYNANCISCHRSRPTTTGSTQAQLSTFISRHNTGRNLTKEQVAAIVAFLKQ